jgi:hypothetical protein
MKQKKSILIVVFSLIFSIFFFLLPVSHVAGQVRVPSIEKLFQDNVKQLNAGDLFYGCIINLIYGEEDLFKQKKEIVSLHVGKPGQYANLFLSSTYYEGDEGTPKINDCYVFTTKWGLGLSFSPALGNANIVKGNYKIVHANKDASTQVFKKEISVDEYFEDGRAYGKRRVILEGEVDQIKMAGNDLLIVLISSVGKEIFTYYDKYSWNKDDTLKEKLRSIKVGNIVKVRGYFFTESQFATIFTTLNVVNFGN